MFCVHHLREEAHTTAFVTPVAKLWMEREVVLTAPPDGIPAVQIQRIIHKHLLGDNLAYNKR